MRYVPSKRRRLWLRRLDVYCRSHPESRVSRSLFGFQMRCDTGDVIQRYFSVFGVWEPAVSSVIRHLLRPGDTFVDIGANVGVHSLLAARCVGDRGRVIALEPFPEAANQLRLNLELNSIDWCEVVEAAVTPTASRLSLYRGPAGNLGATTSDSSRANLASEPVQVRGDTIEALIGSRLACRLLKLDVEGDEGVVLRQILGAANQPEAILFELSSKSVDRDRLGEALEEAGYTVFIVPNDYSVNFYLDNALRSPAPERLEEWPTGQIDVLAARSDAARALDLKRNH